MTGVGKSDGKDHHGKRVPKIRAWFDLSNGIFLLLLAAAWTFGWASVYAYNMEYHPADGLRIPGETEVIQNDGKPMLVKIDPQRAYREGIYFSVVTETTVGYGDAVPIGYSKLFACLQVIGGLAIAGLFIARITVIPTGKARILIRRLKGYWLEFSFADRPGDHKHVTIISFITIRQARSLLRYDGINFHADGTCRGGFEGTSQPLGTLDGPSPWFDYDNLRDKGPFTVGKTHLSFEQYQGSRGQYMHFTGFAHDEGNSCKIPMIGFRVTPKNMLHIWELRQTFRSESNKYNLKRAKIVENSIRDYRAKMEAYLVAQKTTNEQECQLDQQTMNLVARMEEFLHIGD